MGGSGGGHLKRSGRVVRRFRMIMLSCAALALVNAIGLVSVPGVAKAATRPTWLIKGNDLSLTENAGVRQSLINEAFASRSWVGYGITSSPWQGSTLGTPADIFTSYSGSRGLVDAFLDHSLPGPYKWVVLDLEIWPQTPVIERTHPAYFEKAAAALVHQHGMKILIAPGRDLAGAVYLKENIAGQAARFADAVGIQAQTLDGNTTEYAKFVEEAAAQARKANPKVEVGAGLSTDANGVPITANQMYKSFTSVSSDVSWYWLNVPIWPDGEGCAREDARRRPSRFSR